MLSKAKCVLFFNQTVFYTNEDSLKNYFASSQGLHEFFVNLRLQSIQKLFVKVFKYS